MEIKSQTNLFTTGMNLDDSIYAVPNTSYTYAENIRVIANNDGSNASLSQMDTISKYKLSNNFEGNVISTIEGKAYNYNNVYCNIVYILTKVEHEDGTNLNYLYEVSEFEKDTLHVEVIAYGDWQLDYTTQMIFNYEDNDLCKLYITDGNSELKIINVKEGYNRNLSSKDISIFGKCVLCPPVLTDTTSGSLPIGQVQYCYQLFGVHGIESPISPVSEKIPVVNVKYELIDVNGYPYQDGSNSDMGVNLRIDIYNTASVYDSIRLYRIQYSTSTDDPKIFLINESSFNNKVSHTTLTIQDKGQTAISELTIEEFNQLTLKNFKAQVLCKKDNRLFAANITESTWDVDYDVRAYRCNKKGEVLLESINTEDNIETSLTDILSGNIVIPDNHDCINPLNAIKAYPQEDSNSNYSYTLVNNGSDYVFGGSGPNVNYYFLMTSLEESNNNTVLDNGVVKMKYDINTNVENSISKKLTVVSSIPNDINYNIDIDSGILNYANPEIVAKVLSYQRDETYRFGAVFYNEYGIASPVHWIADIRFPDAESKITDTFTFAPFAYSVDSVATNIATSGQHELVSRPLGIRFEFANIPEDVKAIEIVRCRRTESDRTVVTQGALSKLTLWDNFNTTVTGSSDTRPFLIPGFSKTHNVVTVGQDGEHENFYPTLTTGVLTDNAKDVFDFTSADQCFNKDTEIVRPGDYLVPLYVASSVIESTSRDLSTFMDPLITYPFLCNGGIQFQPEERRTEKQYNLNYTGAVVNPKGYPSITDGFEAWCSAGGLGATGNDWIIPCAEFKYFKFYDKTNAMSSGYSEGSTIRYFKNIEDTKIATNIPNTEIITSITDIEDKYIDQVGSYTYQSITIGGWMNLGFNQPTEVVRYGIRGVSLLLYCPEAYSSDVGSRLTGIDDQNPSLCKQMSDDGVYGVQSVLICNVKRNVTNQYGGSGYFSRSNSIYNISCGYNIVDSTNMTKLNCFSGDTYLGVLDHTYTGLYFPNDPASRPNVGMNRAYIQTLFPLESSVNVYLRSDEHFLQSVTPGTNGQGGYANTYYMTEVGVNVFGSQSEPMYTYNSAYSNTDGAQNKVPKSIYDENINTYTNRIITSDIKTNNEIIDSWTKFRFADYLDVDNKYGPITNLVEFNDRLFFFQDDAIGIAQVNERTLVTDQNNAELVLGTGTVLGRYDYVIRNYGDSKLRDKSIITTPSTMYWFDYDKNILCAYNSTIIELSKIKKVQSYLNDLSIDNKNNVISIYDNKYNEVWFRINDKSLIFNEQLDIFSSYYTFTPDYNIRFSDYVSYIYNNNIYYIHNIYNIDNEIEDKICKLQFVINSNYQQTKVYDNVFFDGQFSDLSSVKEIKFNTKTQQTDSINYEVIDNREDTYRFFIPREHLDNAENQTKESLSYAARMRGKYLICDYTFDCNEERQIEIPFIKTTYRDSLV